MPGGFVTTHWSLVLAAGGESSPAADEALAALCAAYWYPLYAYVCRRGFSPADAQDLTQAFFVRLLEKKSLAVADPARGRFRSFLLASLKHFLANEWDRAMAKKRGGAMDRLSIDFEEAEKLHAVEAASPLSPEDLFEQKWALALIARAMSRLQGEFTRARRTALFELMKDHLLASRPGTPLAAVAASAGMSEGAVKVAVHRMRNRFRALLRDEIAATVESPEEIDAEVRHLMTALRG